MIAAMCHGSGQGSAPSCHPFERVCLLGLDDATKGATKGHFLSVYLLQYGFRMTVCEGLPMKEGRFQEKQSNTEMLRRVDCDMVGLVAHIYFGSVGLKFLAKSPCVCTLCFVCS